MKKVLLLKLLLLLTTTANAQFLDNNALFFNGGVSRGNYFGARLGVNIIHKEKYALQAGISGLIRSAKSKPEDYSGGLVGAFFLGLTSPYDEVTSYELLVGRIVRLDDSGIVRLNLKVGATYSTFSTPTNWQWVSGGLVTPNYTYEQIDRNMMGLMINPEIEFPVTRVAGVAISPFCILNKESTAAGVELKLLLGLLK